MKRTNRAVSAPRNARKVGVAVIIPPKGPESFLGASSSVYGGAKGKPVEYGCIHLTVRCLKCRRWFRWSSAKRVPHECPECQRKAKKEDRK